MDYKCVNYSQLVECNPEHFRLIVVYDPCPFEHERSRHQNLRREVLTSSGLVYTQLPLAFTLMTVGQMQILTTSRFGDLFVNTSVKGGHQSMKIQLGNTYLEHIQQEDSLNIISWLKQVFEAQDHRP